MERRFFQRKLQLAIAMAFGFALAAQGQDVITISSISQTDPGQLVTVPIHVRDRSNTSLNEDAGADRTIRNLAVSVRYSPVSAVADVEIVKAGLTAAHTPVFETAINLGDTHSWIVSFDESLGFAVDAASPGDLVAHLRLQLAADVASGTVVELELVGATTALGNASGTILETEANGGLTLTHGTLGVGTDVCAASATALCLLDRRFRVEVIWTDFQGGTGEGQAVPRTDDAGYFWFFDERNVELVIKVLDGRGINGQFWVFYGALSNVAYRITVTDSATGREKIYVNPAGTFASVGDTQAFPDEGKVAPGAVGEAAAADKLFSPHDLPANAEGECVPTATRLCLLNARFQVEVTWTDFQGGTGEGQAIPLTSDTGYFWFFDDQNIELVVKALDGRVINDHFWVFYGALSNVAYALTVTDTLTREERTYINPQGIFASVGDTQAF